MTFFSTRSVTRLFAAVLLAGTATSALAGEKAEVIHWWTSGSEAAAVKVLADAYNKAGGEWVDNAIAGGNGNNAKSIGINRIIGGNPPAAMQIIPGKELDEFVANGYVRDISALAAAGNWKAAIPSLFWDSITRDGKVYGVPIDLHGQTWSWWSIPALKKAGADVPKSWDEFFPDSRQAQGGRHHPCGCLARRLDDQFHVALSDDLQGRHRPLQEGLRQSRQRSHARPRLQRRGGNTVQNARLQRPRRIGSQLEQLDRACHQECRRRSVHGGLG